jgi:very-short-patch-repair endonuclease
MNYSNHPATKEYRQLLRRTETPMERKLWKYLRGKQIDGFRFRQQHGFGPYILDFYCPSLCICIELDGEVQEAQQHDENRTEFLNENRINVM